METLEFIIYPDGRVKETVTGIVGSSCQEVTAAIEEQLGVVVAQQQTSDYYAQNFAQNKVSPATTVAQGVVQGVAQSSYSNW